MNMRCISFKLITSELRHLIKISSTNMDTKLKTTGIHNKNRVYSFYSVTKCKTANIAIKFIMHLTAEI